MGFSRGTATPAANSMLSSSAWPLASGPTHHALLRCTRLPRGPLRPPRPGAGQVRPGPRGRTRTPPRRLPHRGPQLCREHVVDPSPGCRPLAPLATSGRSSGGRRRLTQRPAQPVMLRSSPVSAARTVVVLIPLLLPGCFLFKSSAKEPTTSETETPEPEDTGETRSCPISTWRIRPRSPVIGRHHRNC